MSLRVLELDTLHLTVPDHLLKLSVVSAADIRIPRSISSLEDSALIKALTSGRLWVSRGVACRLDVQVLFNGKPLDGDGRVSLLESLGYRLRDAQLWSLLSLSASLDLWQSDGTADSVRDLSINVNHGLQTPTPPTRHRAWVLDTFDIKPPDNVLCVEFERMQIQFDFLEIRKKAKPIKKVKTNAEQFDIEEEMLLDLAPSFKGHGNVDELAHAVARMGDLPTLISRCFEPKLEIWDELGIVQKSPLPYSTQQKDPPIAGLEKYIIEQNGKVNGMEIMNRTGLRRGQVKNWFTYQRRKIRKDCAVPEDQMLLAQGEDGAPTRQVDDQEEDDMLFSPATDNMSSLTSQSSVASSALSTGGKELALKRPSPDDDAMLLDKLTACDLGEAAIHILTSGYISRGLRGLGGIQVEKPPPILSLARLAPSTFCPGFKESMAHNAHFLPSISHAISVSWPRNIQSPTLREKIFRLGQSRTSSLTNETRIEDGGERSTARLTAVVQSRLWGMMQRKLYDPSDTAKIWRKTTLQDNPVQEDECPDLLETMGEPDEMGGQVATKRDDFGGDDAGDFDDLLSRDDDELLEYMEERERLSIERETEEMLFGSEWDEDDACLLDDEAGSDAMLL
ncbi:hypothetical protein F5882DRAFT_469304 [Hyaloscypha sp. PMI_1271]|nr:hypothetical protein F5882DRAFT_469304 [Hyaloscypha sp. PMI_1271]